tara:strand:- start:224 stop:382 length:159 start_codon:yes stop_codon:yes gene_type:complete
MRPASPALAAIVATLSGFALRAVYMVSGGEYVRGIVCVWQRSVDLRSGYADH